MVGSEETAFCEHIIDSTYTKVSLKHILGAGGMAQQLGALYALPENLGSIPSTQMAAHNHL